MFSLNTILHTCTAIKGETHKSCVRITESYISMSLFANILAKALDFFLTHCEKTLYSIFKTKQSTELKTGQQIKACLKMTFT